MLNLCCTTFHIFVSAMFFVRLKSFFLLWVYLNQKHTKDDKCCVLFANDARYLYQLRESVWLYGFF